MTPKEFSDFSKLAEWLTVKIAGRLDVNRVDVMLIASALADTWNKAQDEAIKELGKLKHGK